MRRLLPLLALLALTWSSALAAPQPRFELPYDLAVARDGTIHFPDRSRVLTVNPSTGRVRVHRKIPGASELAGLALLADGTLYAADLPSGRILRVPRGGPVFTVATVPMPVDLVVDPSGSTLWVASIADGIGLVRVDVASGSVEPFAAVRQPHGVARMAGGDFVVHDGHAVSRVDGTTGVVTQLAKVDAFKIVVARNSVVYGATGGPRGGRVVRISPNGRVVPVAGTGRLGPHRDGRALAAPMLPSAVAVARDGSLLVAQIEPVPAIRRIDLASGRISTIARGR
jgi:streptogramin lyase